MTVSGERDRAAERDGIHRTQSRQQRLDPSTGGIRDPEAGDDAQAAENQAAARDESENLPRFGAEGEPHAEFATPSRNDEREQPVQADAREHAGDRRKPRQHARLDGPRRGLALDDRGERLHVGDRLIGIGAPDDAPDRGDERGHRRGLVAVRAPSHHQVLRHVAHRPVVALLLMRQIDLRLAADFEPADAHVADDADDRAVAGGTEAERLPERLAAVEVGGDERLAHDRDRL